MKKITLLLAAGLLAIVATACGAQQAQSDSQSSGNSSDNSSDQPETVIIRDDSDDPDDNSDQNTRMGDTDADDNMTSTSELPQDFLLPVPNDYQVQRVGETRNEVAVDLQVPDGQQAYDFYNQALEEEGFTIEESGIDNDSTNFDADIDFRNDQYDGSVDFNGEIVEIDYETLNASNNSDDSNNTSQTSTQLPQNFPVSIPNDYNVQNVIQGGDGTDDAGDISVQLEVPDGQQAFDYYNENLQSDGFQIENSEVETNSSTFDGEIDFNSADYDGSIDVNGNNVEIDLDNPDSDDR